MSQPQTPFSARSGLDVSSERRTVRYIVEAPGEVSALKPAQFFALDRARLHAWSLALDGHSVRITKAVYDTLQSPMAQMGSAVIEEWDERSAFVLLNAELTKRR
jgi:hypothetical protein